MTTTTAADTIANLLHEADNIVFENTTARMDQAIRAAQYGERGEIVKPLNDEVTRLTDLAMVAVLGEGKRASFKGRQAVAHTFKSLIIANNDSNDNTDGRDAARDAALIIGYLEDAPVAT